MASVAPELTVLARDQAFEQLYRRYVKDVYHYALALLRNPADAEDVTQTTFMNAYRAYRRGDQIEKPQNWLIKIAHNVARTRYTRANRRVKEVPLEEHVDRLALPDDDKPDIEGILRALGRLPFNQRAALVMRELEGRSYAEIADTLGVSVSAVETLIFRARRSLKVRASALRALAAVPLPGSLAGLLEGGGLAAGGGAITGGFLLKAAVALLAGAVATTVASDKAHHATAAGKQPAAVSHGAANPIGAPSVRTKHATRRVTRHAKAAGHRSRPVRTTVERTHATVSRSEPVSATAASAATSAPAPSATLSEVTAPVTTVVSAVQETVAAATPSLPVEVPPLPSPPVELPPPPKLP
jgi:RNA polymerase sigma factor (sigma-70 family)